jgi:hypothetical protein
MRCKVRVLHALNPTLVGAQWSQEIELDGDDTKWWDLGPDGKRGADVAGAARRLR